MAMSSPSRPMNLQRILNKSPAPQAIPYPQPVPFPPRRAPSPPRVHPLSEPRVEPTRYDHQPAGAWAPRPSAPGPSYYQFPPLIAHPTGHDHYPPNPNAQFVNTWREESVPDKAPVYSDGRARYSAQAGPSNYASHEHLQPSPQSQRGSPSPEIDISRYQNCQISARVSERNILKQTSSPAGSPRSSYSGEPVKGNKRKRGVSDEDSQEPPRSKQKPGPKPKSVSGTNKRSGYAAKKRSDAPTTAQNVRMPNMLWTVAKGKDRDDAPLKVVPVKLSATVCLAREDQVSRCMSNRYRNEDFPKCVSCIRRWAGDTCRFQNIRSFFRETEGNVAGFGFRESQDGTGPTMQYPDAWNMPLKKSYIRETKTTIAAALLPTLRQELQHISQQMVVYRPRESEVRATCDTCLTSIFCCSWMCRTCGREACPDCFGVVKNLTIQPDASQSAIDELQKRKDKHMHASPSFLHCMKRGEHGAKDFSPMSRFSKSELTQAIQDMEQLLEDEGISSAKPSLASTSVSGPGNGPTPLSNGSNADTPPNAATSPFNDSESTLISNGDGACLPPPPTSPVASSSNPEIPYHEITRFTDAELTDEIFRPLWARGDPLLITDVGKKLKINWSPEYFMKQYGPQVCTIIECQTEASKRTTVHEFFGGFGRYDGRVECWKLKDWPPASDFKTSFPELYEDFSQAVPIPNYVRRDGALNIASHFPTNTVGPDLGPKMYNANANQEVHGSKGSTRLHMDMADALNLMTYAAPGPQGEEGCAAWDLFRAQDSDKIRHFIRTNFATTGLDPIHMQQVYLDDKARRQLWEEQGVKSYRVYQKAGEAVFIPAGCAHQVRNLSDCIKVAIDFVSPENIERCEKLTREFRGVNQTTAWKEDVLQLRTMMWFAWLSCCRQESIVGS
ncbi:Clavaminate synthase-like protein [Mycena vitilis]|nr:Clavaminate synthase-like protein [Mycena vitilis]